MDKEKGKLSETKKTNWVVIGAVLVVVAFIVYVLWHKASVSSASSSGSPLQQTTRGQTHVNPSNPIIPVGSTAGRSLINNPLEQTTRGQTHANIVNPIVQPSEPVLVTSGNTNTNEATNVTSSGVMSYTGGVNASNPVNSALATNSENAIVQNTPTSSGVQVDTTSPTESPFASLARSGRFL